MPSANRNQLIVEGIDDKFFVINALKRYGIDWPRNESHWPIDIKVLGGISKILGREEIEGEILSALAAALKMEQAQSVGLILDADKDAHSSYKRVFSLHSEYGLPRRLPPKGVLHQVADRKIGVWIMPDNGSPGTLENLIASLIPAARKPLWQHAQSATEIAQSTFAAPYGSTDLAKSELHCWLAWQDPPGRPYGTAIEAKMLEVPNETLLPFVTWLNRLFDLNLNNLLS